MQHHAIPYRLLLFPPFRFFFFSFLHRVVVMLDASALAWTSRSRFVRRDPTPFHCTCRHHLYSIGCNIIHTC